MLAAKSAVKNNIPIVYGLFIPSDLSFPLHVQNKGYSIKMQLQERLSKYKENIDNFSFFRNEDSATRSLFILSNHLPESSHNLNPQEAETFHEWITVGNR